MKLSQWAKKQGISYKTAWKLWDQGIIPNACQLPTGTILVVEPNDPLLALYKGRTVPKTDAVIVKLLKRESAYRENTKNRKWRQAEKSE